MPGKKNKKGTPKAASTLLTTSQVAAIFEVHPNTIRRWCREGRLNSERVGSRGDRRFRREEVAVFYLDRAIQMFLKGKES